MKFFKTHIKLLAADQYGHTVLLTAYDVIDDTVMTSKTIFPELLSKDLEAKVRQQELLAQVEHLIARIPLLYLMFPSAPKWLISPDTDALTSEVREMRKETSKKDPEKRRLELLEYIAQPLLDLIKDQAQYLAQSTFGCQFILAAIFGCAGAGDVQGALDAIADLAAGKSENEEKKEEVDKIISTPAVGRMLKALVQGGRFDKSTESIQVVEPSLKFHELLYSKIKSQGGDEEIVKWTNGPNSFVVLAMLEAEDFKVKEELSKVLRKNAGKLNRDNKGAAIVLDKIGAGADMDAEKKGKKRRTDQVDEKDDDATTKQKRKAKKDKKA